MIKVPLIFIYMTTFLGVISFFKGQCIDLQSQFKESPVLLKPRKDSADTIQVSEIITSENQEKSFLWCDKCSLLRRYDMVHCETCNVCIEGVDHHCDFMGVCFADKNMRYITQYMIYCALFHFSNVWLHIAFQNAMLDDKEKLDRRIYTFGQTGFSSVLGLSLLCVSCMFFQMVAIETTGAEKMYVKRVREAQNEDPEIEVYDRDDSRANCRRICRSEWNFLYWILPI